MLLLAVLGVGFIGLMMLTLQSFPGTFLTLAVCALCLGCLVVIRPEIGLVATLICAAVVKVEIGTGTGSAVVMSLVCATVLVAGWVVHRMLHQQRINLLPAWLAVPIVCMIGFTIVSWIWGTLTLDPRIVFPPNFYRVQMAQAGLIVVSVTLLFVGGDIFRSNRLRNTLMGVVVAVGTADLLLRVIVSENATGFLSHDTFNTFGLFGLWYVTICWANATLNTHLPGILRLLLAGGACGWLVQAILVDGSWVSGWLPPLIALFIVSFFAGPRVAVPVFLFASIVAAPTFAFFYDLLITTQTNEGSIGGEFGRLELWKRNLEFSQEWLLLGSGPAGYVLYYVTFLPDQAMSTHSNYMDLLSQLGIGGLLSLLSLLVGLFGLGVWVWPRLKDPADRALCASAVGALPGLLLAISFGDWLIPFVYNQTIAGFNHSVYSWLMLAALAGLVVQHSRRGASGV